MKFINNLKIKKIIKGKTQKNIVKENIDSFADSSIIFIETTEKKQMDFVNYYNILQHSLKEIFILKLLRHILIIL